MVVTSYQIQNVIADYSKRIGRNRQPRTGKAEDPRAPRDKLSLSVEGKREAVIDRVAANIIDRITRYGPQEDVDHQIVDQLRDEIQRDGKQIDGSALEFVFNVVDGTRAKQTNTLSAKDSSSMLRRLEQLAKQTVDQNMARPRPDRNDVLGLSGDLIERGE
ncbi:MAG: DVU0524 family FlgM-associated protein [Pseudomonadota bacterium]